MHLKKY